jgi:hypothetical protein
MLTKIAIALVLAFAAASSVSAFPLRDVHKPRNAHHFDGGGPTTTGRGGLTGAPSSTNPAATAPNGLLQAPHAVPENGGAAMLELPGWVRRR